MGIFGGNQDRDLQVASKLSFAENSQNTARVLSIVGVMIFILLIAGIIAVERAIKSSRKVLNDWEDYRYLCDFLESSAKKATEAKNLWQY